MLIPSHIKAVLDAARANASSPDLFEALLALLENASDSRIVSEALLQFSDEWIAAAGRDLRERSAALLRAADHEGEAQRWLPDLVDADMVAEGSNVVEFQKQATIPPPRNGPVTEEVHISMSDIAGLEDVKRQIHRKIVRPFENPELYKRFGRKSGGGILMYGAPGCGKTMLAKAVANECGARFLEIRPSDIFDKYWGDAEKHIEMAFAEARSSAPCIMFFDEVEALAHRRSSSESAYKSDIISSLLREMDGTAQQSEGLLYLAATNVPWAIDPAFRRPGRFDRTLFIPPPDRIARKYLINRLLKEVPVENNLSIPVLVERTSGFSGADVEALVNTAIDFAIDESSSEDALSPVNMTHFLEALEEVRPSIREWLGLAKSYADHASHGDQMNDLKKFLKKYT